ncbi:MAG: thioredoxin fold domain-containing protein [Pirellulales bacterium]|jgi:thioredoxin-related protein
MSFISTVTSVTLVDRFRVVIITTLLFSLSNFSMLVGQEVGFTEDAPSAIKRAKLDKKDVIFLFTGSDWCPPCKKLEKEVLSEKEFLEEISKQYVLIMLDFPKNSPQAPELAKQNDGYSKKFGIESFPTLVLTDSKLIPFAFAGYEEGGFLNYLDLLQNARKLRVNRDAKLGAAKTETGEARARLLDEAISEMRREIIGIYYPEIVEEIVALDKDNSLGLRKKWNGAADAEMRKVIMTDLLMISRIEKPARAIQFIDEVVGQFDFSSAELLEIYQWKLNLIRQLKDNVKMDLILDQMINLEGVTGETRQRLIVKKIYLMVGSGRRVQAMKLLDESISEGMGANYLNLAKGSLFASNGEFEKAIECFDAALENSKNNPDIRIDLIGAKADSMYALDDQEGALRELDDFSEDTQMPADLRAEALLHKAMIMRDQKRTRQARLAENRAIETVESPKEKAEMQKIVDRLRKKVGG